MILLSKVMPWLEDSIKRQEQEAQSEDASLWLLRTKLQLAKDHCWKREGARGATAHD